MYHEQMQLNITSAYEIPVGTELREANEFSEISTAPW